MIFIIKKRGWMIDPQNEYAEIEYVKEFAIVTNPTSTESEFSRLVFEYQHEVGHRERSAEEIAYKLQNHGFTVASICEL